MPDIYSNSLTSWISALVAAAASLAFLLLLRAFILRRGKGDPLAHSRVRWLIKDLTARTKFFFNLFVSLWIGSIVLTLTPHHEHVWQLLVLVVVLVQLGIWAGGLVGFWSERFAEHRAADAGTRMTINVVAIGVKIMMWVIVLLVILDNLGINITALVTGLGIGGIAVALAVQNILGDLFAALSIVLDKPFVVGDAINVGDAAGAVEHIGLKSTRLRSDTGEMIIISNGDLLKSRIRNYRGQEKRLVVLRLGIAYGTPAEKLARVPEIIRAAAEKEPSVKFDRSNFTSFGMFALVIESVYSAFRLSYGDYMNTQQRINLEILRQLSAEGIEIAHQPPAVTAAPGDQAK